MNRFPFVFSLFTLLLFACSDQESQNLANGNKLYGGEISFMSAERVDKFFPLSAYSLHEQRVLACIYEPLFKVNQKNEIIPHLATRFHQSKDGKIVQLFIRKGVLFHENACFNNDTEEMTVEDVAFSLAFACSGNNLNQLGHLLTGKIEGSEAYAQKTKNNFPKGLPSGMTILNDSVLQIKLIQPYNNFIQLLSHSSVVVFSKKAYLHYGKNIEKNPVGTGPFYLKKSNSSYVLLGKNEGYWQYDSYGNRLPFLSEIKVLQPISSDKEYSLFAENKTELLLDINVEKLDNTFGTLYDAQKGKNVLHRVIFQRGNKVNFLGFDCNQSPFHDVRVRKAFMMAVDRKKLFMEVLKGDGNMKAKGFIPVTSYYSGKDLKGVEFDKQRARKLLQEAGYGPLIPFPELDLFYSANEGTLNDRYMKAVCQELSENLGISIVPKRVTYTKRLKAISNGEAQLYKAAWMADYPDPEAYLGVFYSGNKGKNNAVWNLNNFQHNDFDTWYEAGILEKNPASKQHFHRLCDQLLMEEAAVVPLYNEDLFLVLNIKVRDFKLNPNGIMDFAATYVKEVKR
jgi:oligopeptide transport system substrate-binding protein